jgi:hypothetical protein
MMTEREQGLRRWANTLGLLVEKSYGAHYRFSRGGVNVSPVCAGVAAADLWLSGYAAGTGNNDIG